MPINKNAYLRYLSLDRCLGNPHRKFSFKELFKVVNEDLEERGIKSIGRAQFYEDIKMLEQEFEAEIEKKREGKKVFYRYRKKDFSIRKQPIREEEAQKIREALVVLTRISGAAQMEWIQELIPKLEKEFNLKDRAGEVMSFQRNSYLEGLGHLSGLFHAILNKHVLSISYQPFKKEVFKAIIHPYYLKQYNNRWFLFGLNEDLPENGKNPLQNFALDRIKAFDTVELIYRENHQYDFEDLFFDYVGVSVDPEKKPIRIRLRYAPEQAKYIETKPLHGSQKPYPQSDGSLEIEIKVVPNYELESQILAQGERVKVLSPPEFREKIRSRIEAASAGYQQ